MAVFSFFGIFFILAITVISAQEQSLESICNAFPQLQICLTLSSSSESESASVAAVTPSSTPVIPAVSNNNKNDVNKPVGYKASVLAKAFEPHRPSYMSIPFWDTSVMQITQCWHFRFGKRNFEDELVPLPQGLYKKFGGKQKSSYMRFGKRSDAFEMPDN